MGPASWMTDPQGSCFLPGGPVLCEAGMAYSVTEEASLCSVVSLELGPRETPLQTLPTASQHKPSLHWVTCPLSQEKLPFGLGHVRTLEQQLRAWA